MQPRRSACSCFSPNLQEFDLPYAPAGANDQRREGGDRILSHDLGDSDQPWGYCCLLFEVAQHHGVRRQLELHGLLLLTPLRIWCWENMSTEGCEYQAGILGEITIWRRSGTIMSVLGAISDIKKTLNEQVEITSSRIYEKASNPAQWHGRGPAGGGRELIFPF